MFLPSARSMIQICCILSVALVSFGLFASSKSCNERLSEVSKGSLKWDETTEAKVISSLQGKTPERKEIGYKISTQIIQALDRDGKKTKQSKAIQCKPSEESIKNLVESLLSNFPITTFNELLSGLRELEDLASDYLQSREIDSPTHSNGVMTKAAEIVAQLSLLKRALESIHTLNKVSKNAESPFHKFDFEPQIRELIRRISRQYQSTFTNAINAPENNFFDQLLIERLKISADHQIDLPPDLYPTLIAQAKLNLSSDEFESFKTVLDGVVESSIKLRRQMLELVSIQKTSHPPEIDPIDFVSIALQALIYERLIDRLAEVLFQLINSKKALKNEQDLMNKNRQIISNYKKAKSVFDQAVAKNTAASQTLNFMTTLQSQQELALAKADLKQATLKLLTAYAELSRPIGKDRKGLSNELSPMIKQVKTKMKRDLIRAIEKKKFDRARFIIGTNTFSVEELRQIQALPRNLIPDEPRN